MVDARDEDPNHLLALRVWERGASHGDFLREPAERWIDAARTADRGGAPFALVCGLIAVGLAVISIVFLVLFPPLAVFPILGAGLMGLVALIAAAIGSIANRAAAVPGRLERGVLRIVDVRPRTGGSGRLDLQYEIDAERSTGEKISLHSGADEAAHLGIGQVGSAAWWLDRGPLPRLAEFRDAN